MAAERIVIIGAGFTGLAAALELARSGENLQIHLLERTPVLGGLAGDFSVCGTHLEKTYHYLFLSDSEILGLIRELGCEDRLLWGHSTVGVYLDGRVYPLCTPLDVLRFKPCNLFNRLRLGAVVFYLQHRKRWQDLLDVSAHDWMS